jgi:hypothetical protein
MSTIQVNTFYDYSIEILGDFSGGTAPAGQTAPHPIAYSEKTNSSGDTVIDLSAITLGGFDGINN